MAPHIWSLVEQAFAGVLAEAEGLTADPPRLLDVVCDHDLEQDVYVLRMAFAISSPQPLGIVESCLRREVVFDRSIFRDAIGRDNIIRETLALWSRLCENCYMQRNVEAMRAALEEDGMRVVYDLAQEEVSRAEGLTGMSDLLRGGATATASEYARARLQRLTAHTLRHHTGTVVSVTDGGTGCSHAHTHTATTVRARDLLGRWYADDVALGGSSVQWTDLFLASGTTINWATGGFGFSDVGSDEAQARGQALLRAALDPKQLKSYDNDRRFEVKGGQTGTRYRINYGRQMNIDVLNWRGKRQHGLCFLPQGYLCVGDVMLGQKIALELYEEDALKVANRTS